MSNDASTAAMWAVDAHGASMHASATSAYVPASSPHVARSLEPSTLTLLTVPRRGDPKPAPKPRKKDKRSPRHTQRRRK
jgi:hypothetical protein